MSKLKLILAVIGATALTGCAAPPPKLISEKLMIQKKSADEVVLPDSSAAMNLLYLATKVEPELANNLDSISLQYDKHNAIMSNTVLASETLLGMMRGGLLNGFLSGFALASDNKFDRSNRQLTALSVNPIKPDESLSQAIDSTNYKMAQAIKESMTKMGMKPVIFEGQYESNWQAAEKLIFVSRTDTPECKSYAEKRLTASLDNLAEGEIPQCVFTNIFTFSSYIEGELNLVDIPKAKGYLIWNKTIYNHDNNWKTDVIKNLQLDYTYFYMPSVFWLENKNVWLENEELLKSAMEKGDISIKPYLQKLDGTGEKLLFGKAMTQ